MYPNNNKIVITSNEGNNWEIKFVSEPSGNGTYNHAEKLAILALNEELHPSEHFFFCNGRREWTLQQAEAVINFVGIINFCMMLSSNTGSVRNQYLDILTPYCQYLKEGVAKLFWYDLEENCIALAKLHCPHFHFIKEIWDEETNELVETVDYTEKSVVKPYIAP